MFLHRYSLVDFGDHAVGTHWVPHKKGCPSYINIPKCASTTVKLTVQKSLYNPFTETHKTPDIESLYGAILRPTWERYLSGIVEYVWRNLLGETWDYHDDTKTLCVDNIYKTLMDNPTGVYDSHTAPQTVFLKPFPVENITFFDITETEELLQFLQVESLKIKANDRKRQRAWMSHMLEGRLRGNGGWMKMWGAVFAEDIELYEKQHGGSNG